MSSGLRDTAIMNSQGPSTYKVLNLKMEYNEIADQYQRDIKKEQTNLDIIENQPNVLKSENNEINKTIITNQVIPSKEGKCEIHQQLFIKEEELSADEDNNVDDDGEVVDGVLSMDKCYTPELGFNSLQTVFLKEENSYGMDKEEHYYDSDTATATDEEMSLSEAKVEECQTNGFGNHFLSLSERNEVNYHQNISNPYADTEIQTGTQQTSIQDKDNMVNEERGNGQVKGLVKCTQCYFRTRSLQKLEHHIQYSCCSNTNCPHCNFSSKDKRTLQNHVITNHNFGYEVIECPYCRFKSLSFMEIQDHVTNKHKLKKYFNCLQCEFKALSRYAVEYHVAAKHTLQKDFACSLCEYKCINHCSLRSHMLNVHKKKVPYKKRKRRYRQYYNC